MHKYMPYNNIHQMMNWQVCKRAPLVAYEAMECHGGNGYVDEAPIARLFRQAPLNAIWEGSGNVSLG